jgi:hypothetical protein
VDVHPPHQPVRGWKDFALHLLTITVGLFIALTLEAAVQSMHHRHLVRDARQNLRREIAANHARYAGNARSLTENSDRLARDIEQLRDLREGKKVDQPHLSWSWSWDGFNDTAWNTARDSGAISYMDPDAISGYATVYIQQEYVNKTATAIMINEESRAGAALEVARDPSKLTAAEIETLLIRSAEIDLSFGTLQTTMKQLDDMYANALKGS